LPGFVADPIACGAARIYRREVTDGRRGGEDDVRSYVAMIADRLSRRATDISATLRKATEDRIAELRGDARMLEALTASIEANVETILRTLRDDIPVHETTPPAAALEYAKQLAKQGVPVNALVRAYRFGQRRMTELVFAELHAIDIDPGTKVAVIERITTVLLEYVDWVSEPVGSAYQGIRERRLENQNSIRAMRLHDVLAGDEPGDVDADSAAIGYPLGWQHLALIVWYPDADSESDRLPRLHQFIKHLAGVVDTSAGPLFIAADRSSGWAWLPYRSAPGNVVTQVRDFARIRTNAPNVAIGAVGFGVEGFRRSHRQAQRTRTAAQARALKTRVVVAATDSGMLASAVLGSSFEELRGWVADVLGPLASDNDDDAVLRETLRVFLRSGSGYQSAAKDLNVKPDAVKFRVQQAVARRGRPIDDRVDVELALLVCHWYGAAVLQRT
jgi:hypothetical protein